VGRARGCGGGWTHGNRESGAAPVRYWAVCGLWTDGLEEGVEVRKKGRLSATAVKQIRICGHKAAVERVSLTLSITALETPTPQVIRTRLDSSLQQSDAFAESERL
jgi:hypothetical protein